MSAAVPARRGALARRAAAREYLVALAVGAAGAGLAVLALRHTWAQVVSRPPRPLPAATVTVTGQSLAPVASALAIAALATLAAVIATGGVARRLSGALLAGFGVAVAVAVNVRVSDAAVLAAARGNAVSSTGASTTGGSSASGGGALAGLSSAAHVVLASGPWRAAAVLGAVMVVAAGAAVAWRGPRWPVMSSRYERPEAALASPAPDSASMWESLSRGIDPTEADGAARRAPS